MVEWGLRQKEAAWGPIRSQHRQEGAAWGPIRTQHRQEGAAWGPIITQYRNSSLQYYISSITKYVLKAAELNFFH